MNHKLLFLFCVLCVENSVGQFSVDFENKTLGTFIQKCSTDSTDVEEIQNYNVSTPKSGTYALILKNHSSICLEMKNFTTNGNFSLEIEYSSTKNNNFEARMEIVVENKIHLVNTTNGTWITFNITQEEKTANGLKISLKSNGTTFLVNNITVKQIQDVTAIVTAIDEDVTTTTEPIKTRPDFTTRIEDVTTTNQNVTIPDTTVYLLTLKRNEVTENDVTTMQPTATITIAVTTTVEPLTNDTVTTSDVTLHRTEVTDSVTTIQPTSTVNASTVTDNTVTTTEVTDDVNTVTSSVVVTDQSSEPVTTVTDIVTLTNVTLTEQDVTTYNVVIRQSNVTVTTDDVITEHSSTVNTVTTVTDSAATSSSDDVTITEKDITNYYNTTTRTTNVTVVTTSDVTESTSAVNTVTAVTDNVTTTSGVSTTASDVVTTFSNNVTTMKQDVTETVTAAENVTEVSKAHYCFCNYFYSVMGAVIVLYYI